MRHRASERLEKITPGDPLDGVEDPLTSVAPTVNGRRRDDVTPPPANPKRGKRVDGKQPELW